MPRRADQRRRRGSTADPGNAVMRCQRLLLRAADEARLTHALCRALVESGGYKAAWIGLAGAAPGDPARIAATPLALGRAWDGDRIERALRRRATVIARGPARIDALLPRPGAGAKLGLRAAIACLLLDRGRIVGTLVVGSGAGSAFAGGEARQLKELAADVAHVIGRLRAGDGRGLHAATADERERPAAMQRHHLALAQKVGAIGSTERDLRTGRLIWSEQFYRLIDLEPGAVEPDFEFFLSRIHPEDRERLRATALRHRAGDEVAALDFRVLRGDGQVRWLHRVSELLRDDNGSPRTLFTVFRDVTEEKRIRMELEAREARLRELHEYLVHAQRIGRLGSSRIDLETGKAEWSEATFALFGLDPATAEAGLETALAVTHPDDRAIHRDAALRNRAGEDVAPIEFRVILPDGGIRWMRRIAEVERDERGVAKAVVVTTMDITEARQAEAELRRSREHLARVQRVAQIGSGEYDYRTRELIWSDEMYRLCGLDPATKPSPEAVQNKVHPDDRQALIETTARGWRGEDTDPIEFRIVAPDGTIRWISRHAQVLRDAEGRPGSLIITYYDITERKRMEDSLRTSRENLALAQKVGRIGSTMTDLTTGVIEWSDEVYAIFGLDPATAVPSAETFMALVHPDEREQARQRWFGWIMAGNSAPPVERRIVRPDGEERWILLQTDVVARVDGKATKAISTMQDITERKRAELERDEFERQLMQAQKMEAIGKLAGGVAHDFNNLLTVIMGWLELLSGQLADQPDLRKWVERSMNAARRGASLTHSMLAFSRQQPLQPKQIDLAAAVQDVIELLPRTLGETVEVQVRLAADLWRCEADPAQLQNALVNLALNARDAMPGGGKLTIEATNAQLDPEYAARNADVTPGDYVALSVSDTGTGMSPETLARAFEPFFTTKEPGKGSGLGLSMVYGFAKQSNGHVKIYSEVGHGTTVRIYLPRGVQSVAAAEPSSAQPAPGAGPCAILVVEDDLEVRELTVAQLKRQGYVPLAAADGVEGLHVMADHPEIALLLTDLTLPGELSGRALADEAVARAPGLKVLFMSGYTENAIIHHGRLDPGVHLLQKPFTLQELTDHVQAALR